MVRTMMVRRYGIAVKERVPVRRGGLAVRDLGILTRQLNRVE